MCIDLLPEKRLQAIKKKKSDMNTFGANFTEHDIGITITAQ